MRQFVIAYGVFAGPLILAVGAIAAALITVFGKRWDEWRLAASAAAERARHGDASVQIADITHETDLERLRAEGIEHLVENYKTQVDVLIKRVASMDTRLAENDTRYAERFSEQEARHAADQKRSADRMTALEHEVSDLKAENQKIRDEKDALLERIHEERMERLKLAETEEARREALAEEVTRRVRAEAVHSQDERLALAATVEAKMSEIAGETTP